MSNEIVSVGKMVCSSTMANDDVEDEDDDDDDDDNDDDDEGT